MAKIRCKICRTRVKSILPFKCKCENYYCNLHKDPWEHRCSFDYISEQKEKLKCQNQKITSDKFQRIL